MSLRMCPRCRAEIHEHPRGYSRGMAFRRHVERCETSSDEERKMFKLRGRWPRRKTA